MNKFQKSENTIYFIENFLITLFVFSIFEIRLVSYGVYLCVIKIANLLTIYVRDMRNLF
jgi:hypothetical protein